MFKRGPHVETRLVNHCTECRSRHNRVSGPDAPRPGDITICAECWAVQVFATDMSLRRPRKTDFAGKPGMADQIQVMRSQLMGRRPPPILFEGDQLLPGGLIIPKGL